MNLRRIGAGGLLSIAFGLSASAQQIPFELLVNQAAGTITVQSGGTVSFSAATGQSQTAQLTATYTGSGQATISQQPIVAGSAFGATIAAKLPITLSPGGNFLVALTFSPIATAQSNAQMSLPFAETVSGVTTTNAINLLLQGVAPAFSLSYELQSTQNIVSLPPGGAIAFPPTLLGTTAQATLFLTNNGSGSGSITAITSSGNAFHLQGLVAFPATVAAGQSLPPVQILYQPSGAGTDSGQVSITFGSGAPVTINLTGSGNAATFTYQVLGTTPPTTVSPGGTITLPSASLGQTSSVVVQVVNSGNATGTVTAPSTAGQGFQLGNGTVFPQTLAPGASLTFTVNFTPTQPGTQTGTLIINSAVFGLTGVGLGPVLTVSYVAGGTTITLGGSNNTVVFSPVKITQSGQLSLDVKNTGTAPATISNIGIQQSGGPFALSGQPALPVTLAPGADFSLPITFTPTALGFSNANLLLDTTTVALEGSGTQPPALPSYTLSGPSGNVAPMTQPTVGLTLASPYPVAVSGTLTISASDTLPADPAVQFASGGSTVAFTIPANATTAVFGNQGTQLGLQTGTVANTITITPTFTIQTGGISLTPATPAVLQFTVVPAAPSLIALQFTGESTTGFTIQATGFTTTRSLTTLAVHFTTAKGFSMPTTDFTIAVQPIATVWFGSAASQAFGGEFTVNIPFSFQGVVPKNETVLSAIESVSVTVSNAVGSSNTVQAALQ